MKRLLIAAVILMLAAPAAAQDPEFTLDIGTIAPDQTPWAQQLREMEARFERESEGRLRVRVFLGSPDGELSLARQCQDGQYTGVGVSTGALSELVPQMGVFELPYLFASTEEADRIIDDVLFEPIAAIMEAAGFKIYMFSENGFRNFATSTGVAIHTVDDLAGLQMRSQEAWIHEETYRALGGNPVRIAVPEVVTALSTNNVQGFDNTPLWAFAASWFLQIDTWTVSNHIYQPAVITYNLDWYNSLPEDMQQLVLSNRAEETQSGRSLIRAMTPVLLENLETAGVTVYYMTDDEKTAFREATAGVHQMFRDRVEGGGELLDIIAGAR